jgi:hypothetical protein
MRDDIQHILSGKSQVKHHHLIQAACSYLKGSKGTSAMAKDQQQLKEKETDLNINTKWYALFYRYRVLYR